MLSWSSEINQLPVDIRAVTDGTVDPLLPGGVGLLRLVDAVLARSTADIEAAGDAVGAVLGEAGLVDAAAVIGNFQMMNRVADGTGMPTGRGSRIRNAALIELLGLDRFDHADES
jgi:hypothetical protein